MRGWLENFHKNSGSQVAFSLIVARLFGFFSVVILVHLLGTQEFGLLTIVLNITNFFIPVLGFGSSHGLLRFGASEKNPDYRAVLVKYANYTGFLLQFVVNIVMLMLAAFSYDGNAEILAMTAVMMLRLTGLFFVEQAKAESRANLDNKSYAGLELRTNVFIFTVSLFGAWLWGIWGYIIANSVSPFIIFLLHKFKIERTRLDPVKEKEFWYYALPSVLSLLIFVAITNVDIFFAGYYFQESGAAFYRVSVLIPLNLVFIAQIYTQTMFPRLCEKHRNKAYLYLFFRNYLRVYIPVVIILILLGFVFAQDILHLFGSEYNNDTIIKIAFLQMAVAILLRTPLGSLLSAVGLIRVSVVVGAVTLFAILIAAYMYLPDYGTEGLAYIMLSSNIFSGLLMLLFFLWSQRTGKLS